MRLAIIKKTSQEEQQNQTTITTNINYIQNFVPIFLKNILTRQNSVKMKLNQITCTSLEKM